jgi:thiamine pyrophosphokinase
MTVLIFANGDMETRTWTRDYLARATAVIAADGGASHLAALDVLPQVVIGDLDSFPRERRREYEAAGVRFIEHPEAKDETDLELALLHAAAHYEEEIIIFAGIGGRLDQTIANVLLLMHPQLRNRDIRFLTEHQQIWLVHEQARIEGKAGDTVSLIPLGGDVHVLSTTGLRWELRDEQLSFGPARGLSNVMEDAVAEVRIASGYLLCVHTSQIWQR